MIQHAVTSSLPHVPLDSSHGLCTRAMPALRVCHALVVMCASVMCVLSCSDTQPWYIRGENVCGERAHSAWAAPNTGPRTCSGAATESGSTATRSCAPACGDTGLFLCSVCWQHDVLGSVLSAVPTAQVSLRCNHPNIKHPNPIGLTRCPIQALSLPAPLARSGPSLFAIPVKPHHHGNARSATRTHACRPDTTRPFQPHGPERSRRNHVHRTSQL